MKALYLLMVILVALWAATWVNAQEGGSVEAIEAPPHQPTAVGGRHLVCDQGGKVVGYSNPATTTAQQDQQWRDYATKQGWISQAAAAKLDAEILQKSKDYTNLKVREVHQRIDSLNTRVEKMKSEDIDPLKETVKSLETTVGHRADPGKKQPATGIFWELADIREDTAKGLKNLTRRIDDVAGQASSALSMSWVSLLLSIVAICVSCGAILRRGAVWVRRLRLPRLRRAPRATPTGGGFPPPPHP